MLTNISAYSAAPSTKRFRAVDLRRSTAQVIVTVCRFYSPDSQLCAALTIIPLPTPAAPNGGSVRRAVVMTDHAA